MRRPRRPPTDAELEAAICSIDRLLDALPPDPCPDRKTRQRIIALSLERGAAVGECQARARKLLWHRTGNAPLTRDEQPKR